MKTSIRIATALLALLAAGPALAANLAISPATVTMQVATGESGSTTVLGSIVNPPAQPYLIALQLRPVGGSLPAPWLTTQPATITNGSSQAALPIIVRVPGNAAPGRYTALVQPVVMTSSIPLAPGGAPLQLSVTVSSRCTAPPTVTLGAPEPAEFKSPNGRLADVALAGTVSVPAGCTLGRVWYVLADEYQVLGETKDISAAADGSFSVTVPVQVSRRGDDKDGRLYQVTVFAADDAGTGASAPATVVVRHDQRKAQ